jgi:hypothetical protein
MLIYQRVNGDENDEPEILGYPSDSHIEKIGMVAREKIGSNGHKKASFRLNIQPQILFFL